MVKTNKKKLILSSVMILLPIVIGLLLWNKLPDRITTHWGIDGQADGWSGKGFAVFALPLIILGAHWLCILATAADAKNKNQSPKAFNLILWICPIISLASGFLIYSTALNYQLDASSLMMGILGIMFIMIGNYLPKVKQNYSLGIKVVWTLQDEENWNATHRFAGKLWVLGGSILFILAFLPAEWTAIPLIITALVMAPGSVLYSYLYYKKHGGDKKSSHDETED